MKNKLLLFSILILASCVVAKEFSPLYEKWSYPVRSDNIYLEDIDKDGLLEVYVVSPDRYKTYLYAFDYAGELLMREPVPLFGGSTYPHATETPNIIYVDDIGHDGVIDILEATSIRGGGVNVRKLYVIKREYDSGLARFYYNALWEFIPKNIITDIAVADLDNDSADEFFIASLDSNLYVLTQGRSTVTECSFKYGLWSMYLDDGDNDSIIEVLAGSADGLHRVDIDPRTGFCNMTWNYTVGSRVISVFSTDVNSDNLSEVVFLSEDAVYMLDFNGSFKWRTAVKDPIQAWIKDVDNDGAPDVLVLSDKGFDVFSMNGILQWALEFEDAPISLNIDIYDNLFVGFNNKISHFVIDQNFFVNQKAETAYLEAYNNYLENNYEAAITYAEQAKGMFELVGNNEGLLKTEFIFLVTKKNSTILDKGVKASEYYDLAVSLTEQGSFEDAKNYAQLAMDLYLDINDRTSVIKCDVLLSQITKAYFTSEKRKADTAYSMAESYLANNMFDKASAHASDARVIYQRLNDSQSVSLTDLLIEEILEKDKSVEAGSLYNSSLLAFNARQFELSRDYAKRSQGFYEEVGDLDSATESEKLYNLSDNFVLAAAYYSNALKSFQGGELDNATVYAQDARDAYQRLNDSLGVDDAEFLLSEIERSKKNTLVNYVILGAPVIIFLVIIALIQRRRSRG